MCTFASCTFALVQFCKGMFSHAEMQWHTCRSKSAELVAVRIYLDMYQISMSRKTFNIYQPQCHQSQTQFHALQATAPQRKLTQHQEKQKCTVKIGWISSILRKTQRWRTSSAVYSSFVWSRTVLNSCSPEFRGAWADPNRNKPARNWAGPIRWI